MRYIRVFVILVLAAIVALFLLNYQTDNTQKKVYNDDSFISQESDSFSYTDYDQSSEDKALDLKFGTFYGSDTFYNINVSKEGTATVKYDTAVEKGRFKIVLISPERKLTTLAEGSGQGSKEVKLVRGKYVIKLVGDNAAGRVRMSVAVGEGMKVDLEGDSFLAR